MSYSPSSLVGIPAGYQLMYGQQQKHDGGTKTEGVFLARKREIFAFETN